MAAVEGVVGSRAQTVILSRDGAILRLLEEDPSGANSRLIWVNGHLELTV